MDFLQIEFHIPPVIEAVEHKFEMQIPVFQFQSHLDRRTSPNIKTRSVVNQLQHPTPTNPS